MGDFDMPNKAIFLIEQQGICQTRCRWTVEQNLIARVWVAVREPSMLVARLIKLRLEAPESTPNHYQE